MIAYRRPHSRGPYVLPLFICHAPSPVPGLESAYSGWWPVLDRRSFVDKHDALMRTVDVDTDPELAAEFGDRVPVVVIDGEEFACWEVDLHELEAELES